MRQPVTVISQPFIEKCYLIFVTMKARVRQAEIATAPLVVLLEADEG